MSKTEILLFEHLPSLSPSEIDALPIYRFEEYKEFLNERLKEKAEAQEAERKKAEQERNRQQTKHARMPKNRAPHKRKK